MNDFFQDTERNVLRSQISNFEDDSRKRCYVYPTRILWQTDSPDARIGSADLLLQEHNGQVLLNPAAICTMYNEGGHAGLLLDFGTELQGGVQILTGFNGHGTPSRLRVRFGESAMEAMSELGEKGSTNDHAVRDSVMQISQLGMLEAGNTGFRFVRIDFLDENASLQIRAIRAVFIFTDLNYQGSFECSDKLLTRIWRTGAYTVHLNMQNYIWDGIKRDRLVWIGDTFPEISAIQAVFGNYKIVCRTLDFARDSTPAPQWMNGLISYSMWWIMIQEHLYMQGGDLQYLKEQKKYLLDLLRRLEKFASGEETVPEDARFVDWSTVGNKDATTSIFFSLLRMSLAAGGRLCGYLGAKKEAAKASLAADSIGRMTFDPAGSKQAAAMLALAGMCDLKKADDDLLAVGGAKGLSAFLGYFVLCARAMAGDINGCLSTIRAYWGGMLKLGATTFWEEFDVSWMKNACRIDELVPEGKKDVHGDTGMHCYGGYRESLCHGWASGPTPWLTQFVLGIQPLEPGCRRVLVTPHLGNLKWASGRYPTPKGVLTVFHKKQPDGSIETQIQAPEGVTVSVRTER